MKIETDIKKRGWVGVWFPPLTHPFRTTNAIEKGGGRKKFGPQIKY
jgi:hypothetical protein